MEFSEPDEEPMENAKVSNEQHQELAIRLGTIEALMNVNASSVRRLEIRLLGSDDDPESGIIANHSRRIRKLEDTQMKFIAVASAVIIALQLFQKKLMALFGL